MASLEEMAVSNIEQEFLTNSEQYKVTKNNFNINLFQYPNELGTTQDLSHYILFNINVRGKSFLRPNGSGVLGNESVISTVRRGNDSAQLSTEQLSKVAVVSGGLVGAAAGAAIPGLVSKVKGVLTGRESKTGAGKIATAAGALTGAAAGVAALTSADSILVPDTTYRISDTIALYIDAAPSVKYSAEYSNKDLGQLAGIVGGVSGVDSLEKLGSVGGEAGMALGMSLAKIPALAGVGDPAAIIGAAAKVALNPFKEVLFEAIDFRSFRFKYRFFPKDVNESNKVFEIIKRFKYHMHPDLSDNKLFYIYPSEFEIAYYFEGKQNKYFHKFKPCVLESVEITYGSENFSSFKDGHPTEINMDLSFRETEILTKKQIKDGF